MLTNFAFRSRLLVTISAAAAMLMAGCGGSRSSSNSVSITASSSLIAAGQTDQLHATANVAGDGSSDVTNSVTWSSSNPGVATVNAAGLLTGIAPGSTTISVTYKTASGALDVAIDAAAITRLKLSPTTFALVAGSTQQFGAEASFTNNTTADVTSRVTWSVTPANAASITTRGLLTAVSAGSFTVSASSGSIAAKATGTVSNAALSSIAVSAPRATLASGTTEQYTATGNYTNGTTRNITKDVTWTSSNSSVLSINAAGVATAGNVTGATTVSVTARLGSLSSNLALNVLPQSTITGLQVRPTSSSLASGTAEQHSALVFYSDGTQQDVTAQAVWTVVPSSFSAIHTSQAAGRNRPAPTDSNSAAVSVNQTGVDYADQPGAANVQASFGSLQAQSVVLVTNATVNSIAISSPQLLIPRTAKQQFTLNGWFSDGSGQDLSLTANWQSSDPSIATVSSTGVVTGVAGGHVTITASFGGLTTTKQVEILTSDLVFTIIKIPFPTVDKGVVENLAVIGTFSDGTTQDLTPLASWTSSAPSVIQIDQTGLLQAVDTGRAQIVATVSGVSSEASVASVAGVLNSITVLPTNASFALGTSMQFTAFGNYTNGGQADISNEVRWTSADPTVFTINALGRAKSFGIGATTATATLQGISGVSTSTQVTNATLNGITMSPTSAQIAKTTHQQFTATGWFSDGSIQDVSNDVLWSVANSATASVDNDGTVLGLAPGTVQVTATAAGLSGPPALAASSPLTVTNASLLSTTITPGNFELPLGLQRLVALIGTFSDGTTQDLSADAIWQSPTPGIAFVSIDDTALGVSPGIGTIAAQLGNFSSSTQVTVTGASPTRATAPSATSPEPTAF